MRMNAFPRSLFYRGPAGPATREFAQLLLTVMGVWRSNSKHDAF